MATLRSVTSALLSRGVPSPGWYSVLAGVWQLERGLRAEIQRRPQQSDRPG